MTRRRKLPEGVRQLASGRYQARYPVTSMVDGEIVIRQVSAGTFATPQDAKDARTSEMAKLLNGGWVDPMGPRTTLLDWSTQWVELQESVSRRTQSFLRARILPYWGARRLGDITPLDVQRWVNILSAELSPASVRAIYAAFKQILDRAVDYDVLPKTPCRAIRLPAVQKTEAVKLSVADLDLLERVAPPRYRAMVHLSAWGGLRWQECAALRWENVDLEAGLIHVCEAVKEDGTVGLPKNGKARIVPIGPSAVEVLRAHRRDFGASDLLFTTASGTMLSYANFRQGPWKRITTAAGLDPAPTWHDLRHAHAAHMVIQGMDWKVLADRLGHHAPSFTADRYGWTRPDYAAVSVAAIEAAMHSQARN